jgi:hypothetical protein
LVLRIKILVNEVKIMAITAAELEHSIKGINYPASKDELVEQAKKNNADKNIINALKELPEQKFSNPIEVTKAYGKENR